MLRQILSVCCLVWMMGAFESAWCGMVGNWDIQGIMKIRVHQEGVPFRKFVFNSNAQYNLNADGTFSKGDVVGTWRKFRHRKGFVVQINESSLLATIESALNGRGVVFSNLHVLMAKLSGMKYVNGISGIDVWEYGYDTFYNGAYTSVVEKVEVTYAGLRPQEDSPGGPGVNVYDIPTNTGSFGFGAIAIQLPPLPSVIIQEPQISFTPFEVIEELCPKID